MENINLEKWTKKMDKYVLDSGKHLFMNSDNEYYKIIGFKNSGKNLVMEMVIRDNYLYTYIMEIKAVDSNSLNVMRGYFFPQWKSGIRKTVPNFKKMRELTEKIKNVLEKEHDGKIGNNLIINNKIKKLILLSNIFEKKVAG